MLAKIKNGEDEKVSEVIFSLFLSWNALTMG